jgi:O-antigen ligase
MQLPGVNPAADFAESAQPQPQYWFHIICIIASVPFLQGLLTWSWDGRLSGGQALTRILSLGTVAAEMVILMIGIRGGFTLQPAVARAPRPVKILLTIWFLAAVVAMFASQGGLLIPAFILLRYILICMAFAAMIHILKAAPDYDLHKWFAILMAGGGVYLISLTFFALLVPEPLVFPWGSGLPSATNIRHIGNYLAILAIAPTALFLIGGHKWSWPAFIALTIMVTFIAWSGSRAAILGLIICTVLGWLFVRPHVPYKKLLALGGGYAGGLALSVVIPNPSATFGLFRFFDTMQPGVDSSSGRIEIWQNTITQILEQPWIGHGAGRFAGNMSQLYGYDLDNPHNFALQFLYDWGVFGGGAALALLAWLGLLIYRARHNNPIVVFSAVAGYSILLFIGQLEGMLYHPLKMLLVMAMIAPIFQQESTK